MTTRTRHRYRRHVCEWDPLLRRYVSWTPGCTCGWRGDEYRLETLGRTTWKRHLEETA